MGIRERLDVSSYLVIGPENTKGRPITDIIRAAVSQDFTVVQIRAKKASAREIMEISRNAADVLADLHKENEVALLINDRLDVALAAREAGIKVDGVHVGQKDIPVSVCRKYLGKDAIVGLSARANELIDYVKACDTSDIDYFGAGPLHLTASKPDAGHIADGRIITRSFAELKTLHEISPIPVVVGGGVKTADLENLAATGVDGFFVISAIAGAGKPAQAAKEMTSLWQKIKNK